MNWIILWKWILMITVILYGILVIVVAIGGFRDVLSMLKDLTADPNENSSEKTS